MGDKIKTLSEAMRLGATFRPQCFYGFYNAYHDTSCAMGAAFEAIGVDIIGVADLANWGKIAVERWPIIRHPAQCPACDEKHVHKDRGECVYAVVVALNNEHRWTREQIADWVAEREAKQSRSLGA